MTSAPLREPVRTILLDIEGTITSLAFVHDELFHYARSHVRQFLERQHLLESVRADLSTLKQDHLTDVQAGLDPPALDCESEQPRSESMATYIEWLIGQDRKSTALKSLQGKIWEAGFRNGHLRAPIFDDVPRALERWRTQNRSMAIFSSGSVLAQRLLFSHTTSGDLSPYISTYFDTTTGAKTCAASYQIIARALDLASDDIVFISDAVAELDAAAKAGLQVLLCERTGNRQQPGNNYARISSFENVFP